jgi:hypothetical protein
MVTGSESPPTLKAELLLLTPVTVTLAVFAFRLPDAIPLAPTTTLPTPMVVGAMESVPPPVAAPVPVPDRGMDNDGSDALEPIVMLAENVPVAVGTNFALTVQLAPGARVPGTAQVPMLPQVNGPADIELVRKLTVALPVLVRVVVRMELVCPTAMLPKAMPAGLAVSVPLVAAPVPVPDRGMDNDGSDALEPIVMLAENVPAAVGTNFALTVQLAPGARVPGTAQVPMLPQVNGPADIELVRKLTVAWPLLVRVVVRMELVCPTAMLPKAIPAGLAVSVPLVAMPVPVPDSAIDSDGSDAFEPIVIVAENVPVVVGANFALTVQLAPGARVPGTAQVPMLPQVNGPADIELVRKLTVVLPVLVRVVVRMELVCPTARLPNAMLAGLAASVPLSRAAAVLFAAAAVIVLARSQDSANVDDVRRRKTRSRREIQTVRKF